MSVHALTVTGLLAALGCAAGGQAAQRAIPRFRASTRLVQINVIVDGKFGPVKGLAAADFVVTDNGRRQALQLFSTDETAAKHAAAGQSSPAILAPPPAVFSNTRERTRNMVVVLLDNLNTADGTEFISGQPTWRSGLAFTFAKQRALMFLQHVPPDTLVALYGLDDKLAVLSDFSNNQAQLLAALRAYRPTARPAADGSAPTEVPGDFNALNSGSTGSYADVLGSQHAQSTIAALRAIADHLSQFPGRISLVWIMSSPPLSGATVAAALGRDNIAVYTVDARGLMPRGFVEAVSGNDMPDQGLSVRAAVARLQSQPSGQVALQDIATQTGGRAYINTNDIEGAIASAAADSAYSYTLGFYVDAKALDNRFHRLKVTVVPKGMQARYPHGYWALADPPPSPRSLRGVMSAALRSPLDSTAIPLRARVAPAGAALLITGNLDIHNFQFAQTNGQRTGAFHLEIVTQDVTGAVVQSYAATVRLRLSEQQYANALQSGLPIEQKLEPVPGAVTLRILVEDPDSTAVGSVIVPLEGNR